MRHEGVGYILGFCCLNFIAISQMISLQNIKSIAHAQFPLKEVNLWVGPNGSGKSIVTQWMQLMQSNSAKVEKTPKQFPSIYLFPDEEDWKNWAPRGDLSKTIQWQTQIQFMGAPLDVYVQYAHSELIKSALHHDRRCAQPVQVVIEYNGEVLMQYKVQEHFIYPVAIMNVLLKQTRHLGFPEAEEWEEFFKVSFAKAKDFDVQRIKDFMEVVPAELHREHAWQETFFMEFKSTLLKQQLSIRYGTKYELCWKFIDLMLTSCINESIGVFQQAYVIKPKRDLQLNDLTRERKSKFLKKYFGIKPIEKWMHFDNGDAAGRKLFFEVEGSVVAFNRLSQGQKNIVRWVEEWVNVLSMLDATRGQLFFESPRLLIIESPPEGLHPQWQRQWIRMIWETSRIYSNAKIIFHAYHSFLLEALEDLIIREVMSSSQLSVLHFSKNREGITEVLPMSKGYFGSWGLTKIEGCTGSGTFEFTRQLNQMYMRN